MAFQSPPLLAFQKTVPRSSSSARSKNASSGSLFCILANSSMFLPLYFWFSGFTVFSTLRISQRLWKLVGAGLDKSALLFARPKMAHQRHRVRQTVSLITGPENFLNGVKLFAPKIGLHPAMLQALPKHR